MGDDDIFNVLQDLALAHDRRISARGVPYAAFRLIGGRAETALTAIGEHGVFRLTSHGIETPADALALVQAAAKLPLGAAYRAPEDGSAELSVAVFVGDATLSSAIVSRLIDYVVQASAALASGAPAPQRPSLADGRGVQRVDIGAALGEYGHPLTTHGDGLRMVVPLAPRLACSIVLRDDADGWISASADYIPEQRLPAGQQALTHLQKLQRWAAAGRFVPDDTFVLRADVSTPLLGPATARAVVWTASQCAALLQTAARHLGLMVS